MNRVVFVSLTILCLLSVSSKTGLIQVAKAAGGTIYINADGSISPSNAPIYSADNITYTLTGNITANANGIVVERDNIVLNGAGYTMTGNGYSGKGITLTDRNNVTVRNMTIKDFYIGIYLDSSSDNVLSGNNGTYNSYGIWLVSSSNNVLSGNSVTANNETGIWFDSFSDDNILSGNNVTANGWDGVWLSSSSGNTLSGNNVTANSYVGIELGYDVGLHYFSDNNVLSGNNVTNNSYGIFLESSSNNTLSGNNVTANNWYGIRIESTNVHPLTRSSSGNTLSGNMMGGNRFAFGVNGYVLSDYLNSVDASNLVDGRPIYYFVNQSDIVVNAGAYPEVGYLAFVNCVNVTVQELNLTGNGQGLLLAFTKGSRITGNNATSCEEGILLSSSDNNILSGNNVKNNQNGIELDSSSDNVLSGNSVTANNGKGIYLLTPSYILTSSDNNTLSDNNVANNNAAIELDSSDDNVLSGNNVTNSGIGVKLVSSSGNSICHNNFINNTQQALISEGYTNTWNESYPSGGNYWSDYNGTDANHDGIGDTPYVIDANNTDHYPLMTQYTPEFMLPLTMNVNPQQISIGEDVNITIVAKNLDSVEKTLDPNSFGIGGYVFDVEVFNGTFSWRWSDGRIKLAIAYAPVVLQPGENYTESRKWDLSIYFNDSYISPQAGSYEMKIILNSSLQGTSVPITIVAKAHAPSFPILPLSVIAILLAVIALLAVVIYRKKGVKTSQS